LESAPRRDEFRRARSRVEGALGEHTLAGDLRALQNDGHTFVAGSKSGPVAAACWLLDRGRQLPLKVGLNSIGRLPDNDVVIDDATISRRHCAIVVHSDLSVELLDIASKNGTTVNGRKLAGSARLKDGDEIILCDRKLVFVMNSGSPTIDRPGVRHSHFSDDMTLAG
jgi:hypothetical protein